MTDAPFDAGLIRSVPRFSSDQLLTDRRRAGGIMMAQFGLFVLLAAVTLLVAPDQIMHSAPLSQLGMTAQTSFFFNAFLVTFGVMSVALGFFLFRGGAGWFVVAATIVAGLAAVGAGIVHSEPNRALHSIFAGAGFVGYSAMPFAAAHLSTTYGVRLFSYAVGILSLLLLLLWGVATIIDSEEILGINRGLAQRWNLLALAVWTAVFGASLALRSARDPWESALPTDFDAKQIDQRG